MAEDIRASPTELGRAAELTRSEAEALFDVLRRAGGELGLPAAAIGGTPSSGDVAAAHQELAETAGTAVERLVSVLEQDTDSLYQTAFAYQQADREAAAEMERRYPGAVPF